jgi:hypothetical protein
MGRGTFSFCLVCCGDEFSLYIVLMQDDPDDPGERLSDFEEDDEKTMNEHDSMIDAEEEADNSFVVPNDYLSDDEVISLYGLLISTPEYEKMKRKFK